MESRLRLSAPFAVPTTASRVAGRSACEHRCPHRGSPQSHVDRLHSSQCRALCSTRWLRNRSSSTSSILGFSRRPPVPRSHAYSSPVVTRRQTAQRDIRNRLAASSRGSVGPRFSPGSGVSPSPVPIAVITTGFHSHTGGGIRQRHCPLSPDQAESEVADTDR